MFHVRQYRLDADNRRARLPYAASPTTGGLGGALEAAARAPWGEWWGVSSGATYDGPLDPAWPAPAPHAHAIRHPLAASICAVQGLESAPFDTIPAGLVVEYVPGTAYPFNVAGLGAPDDMRLTEPRFVGVYMNRIVRPPASLVHTFGAGDSYPVQVAANRRCALNGRGRVAVTSESYVLDLVNAPALRAALESGDNLPPAEWIESD